MTDKVHYHIVEPNFSSNQHVVANEILDAITEDFQEHTFDSEEEAFWFGVTVPDDLELAERDMEGLRDQVSTMLQDIPTIWVIKAVVREKTDRLLFLADIGGVLTPWNKT